MAIDQASIIEFLQRQHLFQGINPAQLASYAVNFVPITFAKNAVVFMQGNRGDSFYIIYTGKVKLILEEGGEEHNSGTLTTGDYFGEDAILFDRPRSTSAIAATPTIVLHLSRQHFIDLIENLPQIKHLLSATV
jgi:CRP-like cAMP-binding protein